MYYVTEIIFKLFLQDNNITYMKNGCINPYYEEVQNAKNYTLKPTGYTKMILWHFTMQCIQIYPTE